MIQWTAKFDDDQHVWLEVEGDHIESEKWEIYAECTDWRLDGIKVTGAACHLDPGISLWTEPDGDPKKCTICVGVGKDMKIAKEFQARVMSMIQDPNKDKIRWGFEMEEQE